MKSVAIAALTALVSTGALAVPMAGHAHHHAGRHANLHHKRDIVWITEYEVETVTVMKTVYGDGTEPTNSPNTLHAAETPARVTSTSYAVQSSSKAPATPEAPVPVTTSIVPAAYTPKTTTSQPPAPATTEAPSSYLPPPAPVPETTTTTNPVYQAPVPSKAADTPAPVASSAPASPPASYGGGSNGAACTLSADPLSTTSGTCQQGEFTHFAPALGACGITNTDTDAIVAIAKDLFDPHTPGGNPNLNPLCGRKLTIYGKDGKSHTATVTDRCYDCKLKDLDLTISLFNSVTSNGDGRVPGMSWSWN